MTFRDILVHIDDSPQSEARLAYAVMLARKHKAHLTGIYVITHREYVSQADNRKALEAEAETMFNRITSDAGIGAEWLAVDWGIVGVGMVEIINYYAHTHSLIILGQTNKEHKASDIPADLPERVIFGSGRPVLVVPFAGKYETAGERVIVAWKEGRAATRALSDAMPFLVNAKNVFVISIRTHGDAPEFDNTPVPDVTLHLDRYGIKAKKEYLITGDITVANIFMNYAWENGCDLLTIGAFSPSPRGSVSLGSASRYLLDHMTLPVMFSH